jgi:hypothetical protein
LLSGVIPEELLIKFPPDFAHDYVLRRAYVFNRFGDLFEELFYFE